MHQVPRIATLTLLAVLALAACERTAKTAGNAETSATRPLPATSAPSATASVEPTTEDAVAAVRSYFAAIKKRAWAEAMTYWEPGADESVSDSVGFARDHGATQLKDYEVGPPGPIEGAAGSRYITVPVVVQSSGSHDITLVLHGVVTLRRAVVDGATPEQRRWRITDTKWRRQPADSARR
jgi:hypothetical protein